MIRFEHVSFTHPTGTMALNDIDLDIIPGNVLAIVGENGAGKTTLIRHINGLIKPTSGKVIVFGTNTKESSVAKLSRKVGIVFQNPNHQLFSESVEEEITVALKNFKLNDNEITERVEDVLNYFGLMKYKNQSPMMLSGGEKKRLCLAIVQSWDPDVLILDEPTVGQDLLQKQRLYELIRGIIDKGNTVILVSHDIEFLWPLQPRVVVMAHGRIVADGTATSVFRNKDALHRANVTNPQLLELSDKLGFEETNHFSDVESAAKELLKKLQRD